MAAPSKYAVAADTVVLAHFPDGPRVLLIARKHPPLGWAIPGGFVEPAEDLPDAAVRELREETGIGIQPAELQLIGVYGRPERDPRGRTITAAYGLVLEHPPAATAGDDAAGLRWFPLTALPQELAFDHADILRDAFARLQPLAWGHSIDPCGRASNCARARVWKSARHSEPGGRSGESSA